jgi:hypothetical protein
MKRISAGAAGKTVAERGGNAHIQSMVAKVTARGLLIPKRLLRGISRVKISRTKNRITIVSSDEADPLQKLGRNAVRCGVPDASTNHDQHLFRRS